jgi:hypothetical protein
MAIVYSTAAQVLACQTVRDLAIQVERDFQSLSQTNSRPQRTVAQMQATVTALRAALTAAGAA